MDKASKLLMTVWISAKKGKKKYTANVNKKFIFLSYLFTDIFACTCALGCVTILSRAAVLISAPWTFAFNLSQNI